MTESSEMMTETMAEPEKSLPQSQVNEIVKREKAQAADRARREAEMQFQAELEKVKSQVPSNSSSGMDDKALEEKLFNRMLDKAREFEAQAEKKRALEEEAKIKADLEARAAELYMKLQKGKEKYSDFEEVMKDVEIASFPQLAFLAGEMDNTVDVMYELANNPYKLAQLDSLAKSSIPLAKKELSKLAQSIVQNESAKQGNVTTNPPLSRLKSSNVGADNGKMTLRDLKNADWLRG